MWTILRNPRGIMDYRREIDGLRALAVLPVILFHAGFQTFSGGFVGVDVFFVISGYLITTIIVAELEKEKFSLIGFYERRARRILPALFLVMAVCLPFAWFWMLPLELKRFSQSLVAVSTFSSNVLFWLSSNYFDTDSNLKPLLHTWSLAVEEQYYVFFPLLLILMWRLGKQWAFAIIIILAVISLAAAQWGSSANPVATFYLLPTRGWELLIGAGLAFYLSRDGAGAISLQARQLGSLLGLLMITSAIFVFDEKTPFPSLYALVPTLGAALIILCATKQTWVGKLLGGRLFVAVGLISYSAYLWHQPLFAFARHRVLEGPGPLLLGALAVAAFGLAWFSWKYVEAPFRDKKRISRKQVFLFGAAGTAFFAVIGLSGHLAAGYPSRMPAAAEISDLALPKITNGWCLYSVDSIRGLTIGEEGLKCWLGDTSSKKKALLFGDSFAAQYEPLWHRAGMDSGIAINSITTNWCYPSINDEFTDLKSSPAFQQCLFNRKYVRESISNYDLVILGGSWLTVIEQNKMDGVLALIDYAAQRTKLVVIMATPPQYDVDVMALFRKSLLHNAAFDITKVPSNRDVLAVKANTILEEAAAKYPNVIYIDRNSLFGVAGVPAGMASDGIPFAFDKGHISIHGAKIAADIFLKSTKYKELQDLIRRADR